MVVDLADAGVDRVCRLQVGQETATGGNGEEAGVIAQRRASGTKPCQLQSSGRTAPGRRCQASTNQAVGACSARSGSDGDGVREGVAVRVHLLFKIGEIEQLVFEDRAADADAKLFEAQRSLVAGARKCLCGTSNVIAGPIGGRRVEEVAGVPSVVSAIGVGRAVDAIAAGLEADVDYAARLPTVFRLRILFGSKFVNGVDREHRARVACGHHGVHDALSHPGIVAIDAVYQVILIVGTQPVCALGPAGTAGIFDRAGTQHQKVGEVAAVQGQVIDDVVLDGSADDRVGCVDQRQFTRYRDFLGLLTRLQSEIDAQFLIDLQSDTGAFGGSKALEGGTDGIGAGQKVGRVVLARTVRHQSARDISLGVEDGYGSSGDRASGLIGYAAENAAGAALRKGL